MARLVEYVNPHPYAIEVTGPDGKTISISKYSKIILNDWFIDRYTPKFLRVVRIVGENKSIEPRVMKTNTSNRSIRVLGKESTPQQPPPRRIISKKSSRIVKRSPQKFGGVRSGRKSANIERRKKIVGKIIAHASDIYNQAMQEISVAISNEIGIGILSFNRLNSLKRLINSIRKHTDLSRTTVFVSDESTDKSVKEWLSQQNDIVSILNNANIGIAGNTNRLLNCLKRFRYKILLNDDVEVINNGWDRFYFEAIDDTKYHHFCFRQNGLYGADTSKCTKSNINGRVIRTIHDKPHGAVMAFDDEAFSKVGYFDEGMKNYGMEHVDWSNRVGLSGLQPMGFHDIDGSDQYFIIHNERSVISNKGKFLRENKSLYERYKDDKSRIYVSSSPISNVPAVSVVTPIRDIGRSESIITILQAIKAQRYPDIEIILVEQDDSPKFDLSRIKPIQYYFVGNRRKGQDFNKSRAFNTAVLKTTNDKIILHDADILVQCDYVRKVTRILDEYESCHIGKRVLYLDPPSTSSISQTKRLDRSYRCERAIGYFEGGSIAFRKKVYFNIGGFNEEYEGYGVEDCDFFERLKDSSNFYDNRFIDMFHLWHSRVGGWNNRHNANKRLAESIKRQMSREVYIRTLIERLRASYPESEKFYR